MGGIGSGWQGPKKLTVEESLTLDMKRLVEAGAVAPGRRRSGVWAWRYSGEEPFARLSYEANATELGDAWFRISGRVNDEPVDYRIQLETTQPNFGGLRWWFICPLSGQRAAKLHLPPGAKYFAHRDFYGLTYRSCQESNQFRGLFRRLAAEMGTTDDGIRLMLSRGWLP